jgi:ATP-dependent protease HslVU (ClpYQ) peptidase subunit
VKELEGVITDQKDAANSVLADLRGHTATAKRLLSEIECKLTNGTDELKRFRDQFIEERHRLEEARMHCEQQKDWRDWVVLGILLLAMVVIGVFIGCKWH